MPAVMPGTLGDDSAGPTRTTDLRDGNQQVHGKDKKSAHEGHRTMLAAVRKGTRESPIPSHYDSPPTLRD